MADNYCEFSTIVAVPDGMKKCMMQAARETQARICNEEDHCGCIIVEDESGLWLHSDGGYGCPEHAADIIQAVLQKVKINDPHAFSWTYYCSKLQPDEFGGGAVCITRRSMKWFNARDLADKHARNLKKRRLT